MIGKLAAGLGVSALMLATIAGMQVSTPSPASAQPAVQGENAARCAQLTGRQISGATVEKAELVARGATLPPFNLANAVDFCRVEARISPEPGSEIKLQIWLPDQWNGKFVGVGGGGFDGGYQIASLLLRRPSLNGYAGVVTNAGHDPAPEPKWALEHSAKLIDYGHRANHLGAVVGKAVVAAYYGAPAKRAYFHGCSNGGRDALMLAQRHPGDYDAIAVGAPANDFTGVMTSFVRTERLVRQPGVDLSVAKLQLVHDAAIRTCDASDGVEDGLIERPPACRFDPGALQCKPGDSANCLSSAELGVVREIYRGTWTRDGRLVMLGLPVGSEYEWASWLTGPKAQGSGLGIPFFGYMVYKDPSWTVATFDLDRDYAVARKRLGPIIDAVDPDLRAFLRRGGKLLMYHGWDDAAIPAGNTLRFHAAMKRSTGRLGAEQTRLFMLPGVAHCMGGHGPDSIDYFAELDRWSETGVASQRLVATKYDNLVAHMSGLPTKVVRTRPVCVWPKSARYVGTGSIDEAANFVCR